MIYRRRMRGRDERNGYGPADQFVCCERNLLNLNVAGYGSLCVKKTMDSCNR